MMTAIRTYFVAILLTCLSGIAQLDAQVRHMYWNTLDKGTGLPFPRTQCILEDKQGYIWIGTAAGLCRFDGTRFTVFESDTTNESSLFEDNVQKLALDRNGDIIVGTIYGVAVFNSRTGKFRNYKLDITNTDLNALNMIRGIGVWPDGHVWLATLAGMVDWDRNNEVFSMMDASFAPSKNTLGDPIQMSLDSTGCWLALIGRAAYYDYGERHLELLPEKKVFLGNNGGTPIVEGFVLDHQSRLWYSSLGDSSLFCYNPKTGKERQYKLYHELPGRTYPTSVISLFCDNDDRIWISSWNEAPRILDPDSGNSWLVTAKNGDPYYLPIGPVNDFYENRNGEIWLATSGGLCIHSPSMEAAIRFPIPASSYTSDPNSHIIMTLNEDPVSKDFLVGTDGAGLFWYDRESGESVVYRTSEVASTNSMMCSALYAGELWCGTRSGMQIFNPTTKSFRRFTGISDPEFQSTGVSSIVIREKVLWCQSWAQKLYRYDLDKKTFEVFAHVEGDESSILNVYIPDMLVDHHGVLWMSHREGYSWLDESNHQFHHTFVFSKRDKSLNKNRSVSLMEDAAGKIWFSSNGAGLYRIDPETKQHQLMSADEFTGERTISGLANDKKGRAWFGSLTGLYIFDQNTQKFKAFNLEQNISANMWHQTGMCTSDGKLLFASEFDLVLVDPDKGNVEFSISPPLVSAAESGTEKWMNLDNSVFMRRGQNNFTFRFSSTSDASRNDIEYRYQLIGIDDDWIYAGSQTSATYNDVPGGEYKFVVAARILGQDWISCNAPMTVTVEKSIPQTTAFRLTAALCILLAGVLIYLYQRKLRKRRARQKVLQYFVNSQHSQSVEEICWDIARNVIDKLGFEDCVVYLKDPHRNVLRQAAAFSHKRPSKEDLTSPLEVPWGVGIVGAAAQSGKPMRVSDTSRDGRYIIDDEIRYSEIAVPIVHEGAVIGVLDSEHQRKNYFTEEDENILSEIANVCASKIANAHAAQEVKEKEVMLAQINSLLSESQLVSLRAQMNPHFVFNCLNSIQESIVMKKYAEASLYLNKFSKLFRLVLQNSSKSLISLSEEINILKLYLELESMRFANSFQYELICDEAMDMEETQIPSMLLQPFVENALWHGLMTKEGERKLWIRFYPKGDELYVCEIEDNGIGRSKSSEIRSNKSVMKNYESKGISISMDRLNLINMKQNKHATVEIIDLKDTRGNSMGTKVIFELSQFLT